MTSISRETLRECLAEVTGACLVQWRERLVGGLELRSDKPSLQSSETKNFCRRSPAFASFVWRGLY